MKQKLFIGLVASSIANATSAGCVSHVCTGVYVERLYTNSGGLVYVATSGDETQLDCSSVSDAYVSFKLDEPAGNAFYSTLLSAQIANRKVGIRIVNGSSKCSVQYITHDKQ